MRRLIGFLLALVLAGMAILPVFADLIWEPYHADPFFNQHSEDFDYNQEVYEAVFAVDAYREPNGAKIGEIPAGTVFDGEFIYTGEDGVAWMLTDHQIAGDWGSAYVRVDQVVNRYDREFLQDFGDELTTEPPEGIGAITIQEGFLFWTYPGGISREGVGSLVGVDAAMLCKWFYTDPQGDVWGYVGDGNGHHESWICLSAMTDPDRPGATIPAEFLPQIPGQKIDEGKTGLQPIILLPIAVAVGASVILLLWPKKKKEDVQCEN